MGFEKGTYNHAADSVAEATGYSDKIISEEILPRAMSLGNQIVEVAGACPTMVVEIMMDSPVLKDGALDDRDKAMIVVLSGSVAAQGLFRDLVEHHGDVRMPPCESTHGYDHAGKSVDQVFKVSKMEMDLLSDYMTSNVFNGVKKTSEFIENVERVMSDNRLSAFQKAFVEAMVSHQMTDVAAQQAGPGTVLGYAGGGGGGGGGGDAPPKGGG